MFARLHNLLAVDEADPPYADAPEGWYPDPYARRRERWWDGARWTAYAGSGAVEWDDVPFEEAREPAPAFPSLGAAAAGIAVGLGLALSIRLILVAADRPGGRAMELGASQLGLWAGLVGACVYVSRRRGTGSLVKDFGWRIRRIDVGLGFAGSIAARLMAGTLVAPIPTPFHHVRAPDRSVFEKVLHGPGGWTLLIVITCVGAPLVEELFFRGLLQTRLVGLTGPAVGITLASLLFGAAHLTAWQGPITFVYAWAIAGCGLALGTMYYFSGRLGTSTMAHAFFNGQAMLATALLSHIALR